MAHKPMLRAVLYALALRASQNVNVDGDERRYILAGYAGSFGAASADSLPCVRTAQRAYFAGRVQQRLGRRNDEEDGLLGKWVRSRSLPIVAYILFL